MIRREGEKELRMSHFVNFDLSLFRKNQFICQYFINDLLKPLNRLEEEERWDKHDRHQD